MGAKRIVGLILVLAVVAGGLVGWDRFRRARAGYDAYRTLIQPGVTVGGVEVGWLSSEEARAKILGWLVEPYTREFRLAYLERLVALSPVDDLGLRFPVDERVSQALAASHQYDYWQGFLRWIQGEAIRLDLDLSLEPTFDGSAAQRFFDGLAARCDVAPVEPMVDVRTLTFLPGRPGHRLDVARAAEAINERVLHPEQREVVLPVAPVEPDQSPARIESMLSTLGPVMERPPTPPSFYTDTLPLSTTMAVTGTPPLTHTTELTWTLPQFAGYSGPYTSTYAYFFDPGKPGARFDVERATLQVEQALRAGITTPITFEPDPVPPSPITPALLIPPLEERLGRFPGVSSLLVKNLTTGQTVYDANTGLVLSGMSIVKIGIMVEVYRHYQGSVDEQTAGELRNMLGSESCNPCANRLLAAVGGGSASTGALKVTNTMHRLGLSNFRLCGPFRIEARRDSGMTALVSNSTPLWSYQETLPPSKTPGYDRCIHATPAEMAGLLEMIYEGAQGRGQLVETIPELSAGTCQEMIDIMAANDLRNMLGAGIPADVKLAHKHGFAGYGVSWGDTRAEVGIVFSPGATWLVSFYIWDDTPWLDFGVVQPLYRDVSNLLYNFFNPQQPYWPRPPWAPAPSSTSTPQARLPVGRWVDPPGSS